MTEHYRHPNRRNCYDLIIEPQNAYTTGRVLEIDRIALVTLKYHLPNSKFDSGFMKQRTRIYFSTSK